MRRFALNPIMLEIAYRIAFHIKNRVHAEASSSLVVASCVYNYYERDEVTFNSLRKVEFLWKSTNLESLS